MFKKVNKRDQFILESKKLDKIKITISKNNLFCTRTDNSVLNDIHTFQIHRPLEIVKILDIDRPLKYKETLNIFLNNFPEIIKWNSTKDKLKLLFNLLEENEIIKFANNDNVLNHFCDINGKQFSHSRFKKIKWKIPQIDFLDLVNHLIEKKLIHSEYKTKKYKLFEPHFSGINFKEIRKNYTRHSKSKPKIPKEVKEKLKINPSLINSPRYSKYNLKIINRSKKPIESHPLLKKILARF